MSGTLTRIQELVAAGDLRISRHAYQELAADDIMLDEAIQSLRDAELIEDYPDYYSGPTLLALQWTNGEPLHTVWGIPKGADRPAVLVTAYKPAREKWQNDWKTRRRM